MTAFGLKKMIDKFESGSFDLKCGRGRKAITSTSVEDVATALQKASSCALETCSARGISRTLDMPVSTVHKILRNILQAIHSKLRMFRSWFLLTCQNEKLPLAISCSNGSGRCMAMEHFVDRRSPFPSPRFCQYSELQNMGKRESVPNVTIASSFSKGHCVVRVYGIIYSWLFIFRGDWSFGTCSLYSQWDTL
ncbi:hypothetical protein AVEN_14502-1 [Araneus ventricosus]|uniref:Uncharacterized protein n=1 Tax=Araneus ventricosus TaxID=182803 RepID=A0A4Y2CGK7_ARAVE|nr:hypothetical protein AVEN_14502-1 [Araneus ventricosus]